MKAKRKMILAIRFGFAWGDRGGVGWGGVRDCGLVEQVQLTVHTNKNAVCAKSRVQNIVKVCYWLMSIFQTSNTRTLYGYHLTCRI